MKGLWVDIYVVLTVKEPSKPELRPGWQHINFGTT
jgi:hypothetical protein